MQAPHASGLEIDVLTGEAEAWDAPDVPALTLPRFPLSALPEWHVDFVEGLAQQAQVAPELPALLSCAAIGGAAAKRIVLVNGPERHPLHLWALVPMDSGEGKTPIVEEIALPFRTVQEELRAKAVERDLDSAVDRDVLRRRRNRLAGRLEALEAREDGDAAVREVEIPRLRVDLRRVHELLTGLSDRLPPTLLLEDATPAALTTCLANHGGVATLISDEATTLFRSFFQPAALADPVENLCKAFSGADIEEARIGRGQQTIRKPALGMLLATQPQAVRRMLKMGAFGRRGFLERFLYLMPPSRVGSRANQNGSLDSWTRSQYVGLIRSLLELPVSDRRPRELRLGAEARILFDEFCREIDRRMAVGDLAEPPLCGWANKVRENTARLAGVLHISQALAVPADDATAVENLVGPTAMAHAIAVLRVCIEHAKHLLGGFAQGRDEADVLVGWFRRRMIPSISARDLRRSLSATFPTADKLADVLAELEQRHVVRLRVEQGDRGRSSPQVDVNPRLWAATACDATPIGHPAAKMPKIGRTDGQPHASAFRQGGTPS